MKKVLFLFAFAVIGTLSFGQSLPKGSLLGLHMLTVNLNAGVTMADYTKFLKSTAIPAYENAFPGTKMYLLRSLRGQDSSSLAVVFMFKNEADRNKYFKNDGTTTELGNKAIAKLGDLDKEQAKYLTSSSAPDKYNDWLVE